jgi:hypothetical protein
MWFDFVDGVIAKYRAENGRIWLLASNVAGGARGE